MIRPGGFQWKQLVQLGPVHWEDFAPWHAARVAVGVVVPLALGWASGHREDGGFAALGALPAGFASFQGVSRSRIAAVGAASIGMAFSTFLGATVATMPWLLLMAVIAYGYATGLTVCLGTGVSVVVLQWVWTYVTGQRGSCLIVNYYASANDDAPTPSASERQPVGTR